MADESAGRELVGIGGWLLFFLLTMAVFSPLVALVALIGILYGDPAVAAFYGPVWPTLQAFEWTVLAVSVAGFWYLAWRMVKVRRWRTVRIVIAGIWLLGPCMLVVETLGVATIAGLPLGELLAAAGPDFLRPFVYCIIWTAYLLRSERVANTYPRAADGDELARVFG